mgnify:CR=1 FL=1
MTYYSYLFETRSIQEFLFANGKLKDMVSGSEMVDMLLSGPLDHALSAAGLDSEEFEKSCPRRAGGAFYLLAEDAHINKLNHFRILWRLLVNHMLPGIEQVDVVSSGAVAQDALRDGLKSLRAARNQRDPELPPASPATQRDPRTGMVAFTRDTGENIDMATAMKRSFRLPSNVESVAARFIGSALPPDGGVWKWPNSFADDAHADLRFPMQGRSYVALIHADGNGMGQLLMHLNKAFEGLDTGVYVRLFRSFSDGLAKATRAAAAEASKVILDACNDLNVLPARPLVLGGDDITLIVRDDLAFEFTELFLAAFEKETENLLQEMRDQAAKDGVTELKDKLPEHLSACAGIVFMKPSQPFSSCHDIAEGLCDRAKKIGRSALMQAGESSTTKVIPSSISFHKLKAALIEDEEELFKAELVAEGHVDRETIHLGLPGYAVQADASPIPSITHLKKLAEPFADGSLNPKRLRRLLTLLHQDPALARQEYRRWREVSKPVGLKRFDTSLAQILGPTIDEELPATVAGNAEATSKPPPRLSPLVDLLIYLETLPTEKGETDHDD